MKAEEGVMKVSDVMVTEVVTCSPDEEASVVAKRLRESDVSGLPVVEDGGVVGVVSEADLLDLIDERQEDKNIWLPSPFEAIELPLRAFPWREWLDKHDLLKRTIRDIGELPVREIMSTDVVSVGPDTDAEVAAHKMVRHDVNRLPVVRDGELVGLVTRGDILEGVAGG